MLTGATVLVLHVPVLVPALLLLSHAASAQPSTCDKDSGEKWCESLQTCHYDWDIWCPTSASCQTDDDCRVWLGGCGPYGCQCIPLGIDEPNPTECDPGMLKPCACAGCIPGRCDDVAAACVEGTCGLARTEPEPTITMLPAKKIITGTKCGAFDMILDIRSKEEWDAGHVMGATHMDLFNNKDAEQTMKHLEGCKQCRVAVFDEEGPKMKNATRFLLGGGFERLYGGFNISQMEYQMVNVESVEPKCVSEGADTCTSQISKLFCPVKLKQLSKPVEKMGIKQLTSLVPTEDDADLEYCNSLDRFRIEAAKVAVDGEFPDMTIKLARKFRKKAKKLMKQRDCSTIIEK